MVTYPRADTSGRDDAVAAVWATVASPWGPVHVAVSRRGVVAVSWLGEPGDLAAGLARRLGGRPLEVAGAGPAGPGDTRAALLERTIAALERWLDGEPEPFDLPIDLAGLSGWDRTVLDGVRRIPWGRTESYGGVARMIGRPGAARAVGGAVSRNPIGVIVPCHRVIAGDGSLGGYGGDAWGGREARLELKRALLRLEGLAGGPSTD